MRKVQLCVAAVVPFTANNPTTTNNYTTINLDIETAYELQYGTRTYTNYKFPAKRA
ncbi:MAG: hypothetical protein LLG37_09170 [Spirochaetia bacterium]|nr:hypothetical protein [Spirochaetia bacterium]